MAESIFPCEENWSLAKVSVLTELLKTSSCVYSVCYTAAKRKASSILTVTPRTALELS